MITRLLTLPLLLTSLATAAPLRIGDVIITGNSTISNQSQFRAALGLGSAATSNATSFVAAANGTATNLTLNGTVTFGNNTQVRAALGIENGSAGWVNKASMLWDDTNSQEAISIGDAEIYINGSDRQEFLRQQLGIQVSQTANGTTTWTSNATRDAFRGSLNLSPVAISGNYSDLVNKPVTGVSSVAGKTGNVTLDITDVPGLATTLAGKEPSLSTGSMTQYYRGDKTWVNFPQVVQGSGITVSGGPLSSGSVTVGLNATIANLNNSTSSQLAGVLTDETGTGSVVFSNNATLTTPNIGAATSTSLTSGDISASGNFTVTGQTVTRGISISSATTTFGFAMNRNVNTGAILNNSVGAAQFTFNGALGLFGLENYSSAGGINGSFIVGSNYLGFNTSYAGAADVSLGRNAAGIMQIGNGTNNASGSLLLNTLNASGNLTLTSTTATLTNNGSTTLGDASGDAVTINAGTITAPNASSVNATNVANVGTLDARYGRLSANQTWTGANTFNGTLSFGNNTQVREALQSGMSIIAAHGTYNDQTLKILTTTDYGKTVTQLGSSRILAGGNFVRDPNIIYLNGTYYVAATAAWIAPYFNIFSSTDLVNWTLLTRVPTATGAITAWSPCFFTEPSDGSLSIIFSASPTVNGGGYADANQFYRTTPTVSGNLTSWTTPTQIVVNGVPGGYGSNMFGVPIIKVGATYNMFFIAGPGETVYRATSSSLGGNYTSGNTTGLGQVDGIQSVITLPNGNYRMLIAPQGAGEQTRYADSSDLTNWTIVDYVGGQNGKAMNLNNASILPLTANATSELLAKGQQNIARPLTDSSGTLNKSQYTTSASAGVIPQATAISVSALSGNLSTFVVTATVASTANLTSNMTLQILGASDGAYNIEAPITVTSNTTFTYSAPGLATSSPTGTILAYNYWIELFSGECDDNANGLLSLSIGAAGARHNLMASVSGSRGAISSRIINSVGYGWPSHIRTSAQTTNFRIEARIPSIYSYSFGISAVYDSYAGKPPQSVPLRLNSPGPYSDSSVTIWAQSPIMATATVPTPSLAAGATTNTYWNPFPLPTYGTGWLFSPPAATLNFVHPGLPTDLVLQNIGQGPGANYLSLQWKNVGNSTISAGNYTATMKVEYPK